MHPLDCPEWEYSNYPDWRGVVSRRVSEVLTDLVTRRVDTLSVALDTREVHRRVFQELTPACYEYYAGHYRGESFRCLRYYAVAVQGDPRVGVPPESVALWIRELIAVIRSGLMALDTNVLLTREQKLRYVVALACRAFVQFLTVHPYANGNGHAGRFVVWSMLGRYGHWPRRWPVHPRPPDPPYSELIRRWRDGDTLPLESYLLQTLIP
jgi:fido (protein-threonine AMPylation protein)